MNSTANIIFVVILAGLVYFTDSLPNQFSHQHSHRYPHVCPHHQHSFRRNNPHDKINPFLYKLEKALNISASDVLPFTLKDRVVQDLGQTSDHFKQLCLDYLSEHESEEGELAPLTALNRSIYYIFYYYKESAEHESHILEEIESVDPIGLNAYLTKKNVENSSPRFMEFVMQFQETMYDRVHLYNMRFDNSYITIFDENHDRTLHHVCDDIRKQITTEFGGLRTDTLDLFTDMVTEQLPPGMIMYRMNNADNVEYDLHTMVDMDDVQISYGEPYGPGSGHGIATYYMAADQKIYVYDSAMICQLDGRQKRNIYNRYPYNTGIEFKEPTALQGDNPTCALFAIAYATMLLMGEDPSVTQVKINTVQGDPTLYIRMHLLNMLVNRKFAEFK